MGPFVKQLDPNNLAVVSKNNTHKWKELDVYILFLNNNFFFKAILLIFLNVYFLRERDRGLVGEEHRERETQNLQQAPGAGLSAQSMTRGLNSGTMRS